VCVWKHELQTRVFSTFSLCPSLPPSLTRRRLHVNKRDAFQLLCPLHHLGRRSRKGWVVLKTSQGGVSHELKKGEGREGRKECREKDASCCVQLECRSYYPLPPLPASLPPSSPLTVGIHVPMVMFMKVLSLPPSSPSPFFTSGRSARVWNKSWARVKRRRAMP